MEHLEFSREIAHMTDRWAIIRDANGHHLAIEPTSDEVWNDIVGLWKNRKSIWVGGVLEEFGNKWGFRFKPETINSKSVVFKPTCCVRQAQGFQAISETLDWWIQTWSSHGFLSYVWGEIV